jgi:hypothetical protein
MPHAIRHVPLHRRQPLWSVFIVCAAVLQPWPAPADSNLQSGARTAKGGASAHLDFRIIIPPVLGLSVVDRDLSPENVEIFSNGRHVTVNAETPAAAAGDATQPMRASSTDTERRFVLRAVRGRVILETTACQLAAPRVLPHAVNAVPVVDTRPVLCTVAMP